MRITVKRLIGILLILIFFASYHGAQYFMHNRIQEVALALTLLLFIYGAVYTALTDRAIRWSWWFWTAPLFVAYVMLSSSIAFSVNAYVGVAPSLFAARELMILILAPTLYFLYRLGFPLKELENVFAASLVLVLISYVLAYHGIDREAAYFSDGYMSYLVTYDEWRGYRLKYPEFAMVFMSCYAGMRLLQSKRTADRAVWLLLLGLVGYVWMLVLSRSQMATLAMALLLYPIFFSRPNRINLLMLVAPIAIVLLAGVGHILLDNFMHAEGAEVRAKSYLIAWRTATDYPVFGFGQSSGYSKTYNDIFGEKFFPDDLGIVGIAFKYGFVGAALYLFFNFYVVYRLLKANWYYRKAYGAHNPVIWSLLILMTALSLNLILIPGLAYIQGLTTAAFAIAITTSYFEEMGLRANPGAALADAS